MIIGVVNLLLFLQQISWIVSGSFVYKSIFDMLWKLLTVRSLWKNEFRICFSFCLFSLQHLPHQIRNEIFGKRQYDLSPWVITNEISWSFIWRTGWLGGHLRQTVCVSNYANFTLLPILLFFASALRVSHFDLQVCAKSDPQDSKIDTFWNMSISGAICERGWSQIIGGRGGVVSPWIFKVLFNFDFLKNFSI